MAKLPSTISLLFSPSPSEADNHLGTSTLLEYNREDWGSSQGWKQATGGLSGAQLTKNSARLDLAILQMAAPVPEVPTVLEVLLQP